MNVRELYSALDKRIPRELSCSWDNDGLMCCPNGSKEVKKVLTALDVTGEVVDYARDNGYDVIISHHPFIFNGLKSVDDEGYISSKVIKIIEAGISVMSFHTRLDACEGGVNDKLAELLELSDVGTVATDGIELGRIGYLKEPIEPEEFAKRVKELLGAPYVFLANAGVKAHKVAVVGGGGGSFISAARELCADTYLSGTLDYHAMTDAPDFKYAPLNLVEAGHFFTEHPVCGVLKEFIFEIDPSIECDVYFSNVIKAI